MTSSATAPQDSLPGTIAPDKATPAEAAPASRKRLVLFGAGLLVIAGSVGYWLHSRHFEDTDDAQVDGTISNVGPRITGTVIAVHVIENQAVKAGDLLAEIDPSDLQIALTQARAQVAQAQAQLEVEDPSVPITQTSNVSALAGAQSDVAAAQAALSGARKDVQQLTAQLAEAQANDRQAQLEKGRSEKTNSRRERWQSPISTCRRNAAVASSANVEALRQSLAAARDRVAQQQAQIATLQMDMPRSSRTRRARSQPVRRRWSCVRPRWRLLRPRKSKPRRTSRNGEDQSPRRHGCYRKEVRRGRRSRLPGTGARRDRGERSLMGDGRLSRDAARTHAPRATRENPRGRDRRGLERVGREHRRRDRLQQHERPAPEERVKTAA